MKMKNKNVLQHTPYLSVFSCYALVCNFESFLRAVWESPNPLVMTRKAVQGLTRAFRKDSGQKSRQRRQFLPLVAHTRFFRVTDERAGLMCGLRKRQHTVYFPLPVGGASVLTLFQVQFRRHSMAMDPTAMAALVCELAPRTSTLRERDHSQGNLVQRFDNITNQKIQERAAQARKAAEDMSAHKILEPAKNIEDEINKER